MSGFHLRLYSIQRQPLISVYDYTLARILFEDAKLDLVLQELVTLTLVLTMFLYIGYPEIRSLHHGNV